MNIDLSIKQEVADRIAAGNTDSVAVRELQECVQRLGGTLSSKGLRSAPTEYVVTGISAEQEENLAVSQLLRCDAVEGAYIKPATELPGF